MRNRLLVTLVAVLCSIAWLTLAQAAERPKTLTLGTASPGGVYYVYGEGVAQILTEKLGIPVNALPTQGPVHNVRLLESNGLQLGLTTMGVALQGWNGDGDWAGGKHHRSMRALFPMYDTSFTFVALQRSKITNLTEVNKLRVGVGPRAGTGGTYVPGMLKALGVSAEIQYGSFADQATDLLAGRYEVLAAVGGIPFPALLQAEAKEPLNFIALSPDERARLQKAFPELSISELPPGTYPSLKEPYVAVGVYNFAIGRADLPDDLVYQLVKAIHDNQAQLVKVHSTANETLPQNVIKNTFLPMHPGAIRYYREIGIAVPASLIPAN